MNKTVKTVFLLIGTIVLIFIVWQLVFNDGGIIRTLYNAFVEGVNKQWHKVAGDDSTLLPDWGSTDSNGKGFDIDATR